MTTWFTSDLHIGHANILKYTDRPFTTVEEMNAKLIENWNAVVLPSDTIYVLGDFSMRHRQTDLAQHFAALQGSKHLIRGNHDSKDVLRLPWASQADYADLKLDGFHVVLFHYAIVEWNRKRHGAIHLHGHHHGTIGHGTLTRDDRRIDVGVDSWDFAPVSWDQLKAKIFSHELPEHSHE